VADCNCVFEVDLISAAASAEIGSHLGRRQRVKEPLRQVKEPLRQAKESLNQVEES
jgi:hypothetical protein